MVTEECKELWKNRYREYLRESSALYQEEYSKEERNTRFMELYQKYRRVSIFHKSHLTFRDGS